LTDLRDFRLVSGLPGVDARDKPGHDAAISQEMATRQPGPPAFGPARHISAS